ncbi:MAG: amidohydrolase family protein [Phycisphaerales bacterium]
MLAISRRRWSAAPAALVAVCAAVCVGGLAALAHATLQPTAVAPAEPAQPPSVKFTLIRCGTLHAVPGQPPIKDASVLCKDGIVVQVTGDGKPSDLTPANTPGAVLTEVDWRSRTVTPGLIDCHVHLADEWNATLRARFTTEGDSFAAVRAASYAKKTIDAGFTTVRDLGARRPDVIFGLRDAINAGFAVGPRIIASGHPISMTGGHGDFTLNFRPEIFGVQTPDDGVADGPEECMKAVRNQIKLGADVIKVTATGGVLSASSAGLAQHYFDDELAAIVRTAHSMGRRVAAHAHGTDGINAAIRAGVDSIEHGTYLDDSSIALLKERAAKAGKPGAGGAAGGALPTGICYHVPTLLAAATVAENAEKSGYYLKMVAEKARLVGPKAVEMFHASHKGGVKIAFGTDTGVSAHGGNAREFTLMIAAGMSPTEALVSATVTASALLGLEKDTGTIEVGKAADLVAFRADPTSEPAEFERAAGVIKGGDVVKNDK